MAKKSSKSKKIRTLGRPKQFGYFFYNEDGERYYHNTVTGKDTFSYVHDPQFSSLYATSYFAVGIDGSTYQVGSYTYTYIDPNNKQPIRIGIAYFTTPEPTTLTIAPLTLSPVTIEPLVLDSGSWEDGKWQPPKFVLPSELAKKVNDSIEENGGPLEAERYYPPELYFEDVKRTKQETIGEIENTAINFVSLAYQGGGNFDWKSAGIAVAYTAYDNVMGEVKNYLNPLLRAYHNAYDKGFNFGLSTYQMIMNLVDENFWKDIGVYLLEWGEKSITSYATNALTKLESKGIQLVKDFPIDIASYTTSYYTYYLKYYLEDSWETKNMVSYAEIVAEQEIEKQQQEEQETKLQKFNNKIKYGMNWVNTYVSFATSYLDMAMTYAVYGYEWLGSFLEGCMEDYIYCPIGELRDGICEEATNFERKTAKSIGERIGKRAAKKVAKKTQKVQEKVIKKAAAKKAKAKLKIKSATAKAIQKVKALVGL